MRVEVHVHGNIQLRAGVTLTQLEVALQPWLDYLDVENIDETPMPAMPTAGKEWNEDGDERKVIFL